MGTSDSSKPHIVCVEQRDGIYVERWRVFCHDCGFVDWCYMDWPAEQVVAWSVNPHQIFADIVDRLHSVWYS